MLAGLKGKGLKYSNKKLNIPVKYLLAELKEERIKVFQYKKSNTLFRYVLARLKEKWIKNLQKKTYQIYARENAVNHVEW